jgi:hypothetical protein
MTVEEMHERMDAPGIRTMFQVDFKANHLRYALAELWMMVAEICERMENRPVHIPTPEEAMYAAALKAAKGLP